VNLPFKVATLLYCFNERDEILLLERARQPNLGFWSPCGGKLKTEIGESPYVCAAREAHEELGLQFAPSDFHLAGLVSEHAYQSHPLPPPNHPPHPKGANVRGVEGGEGQKYMGQAHWLMFLFELKPKLEQLPPPMSEGRFQFFPRAALDNLHIPQTDRERIWPWFWQYRGGFFAAHCHCHPDGRNDWTLEESRSARIE